MDFQRGLLESLLATRQWFPLSGSVLTDQDVLSLISFACFVHHTWRSGQPVPAVQSCCCIRGLAIHMTLICSDLRVLHRAMASRICDCGLCACGLRRYQLLIQAKVGVCSDARDSPSWLSDGLRRLCLRALRRVLHPEQLRT